MELFLIHSLSGFNTIVLHKSVSLFLLWPYVIQAVTFRNYVDISRIILEFFIQVKWKLFENQLLRKVRVAQNVSR